MDELSYTGFERIRRVFNRAFGEEDNVPTFSLAVDAGCGTGLAGEQVRYSMNEPNFVIVFCLMSLGC